nr:FecR domain-containing protein [Sphingomonas nostoxanthinifaciens]
MLNGATRMTLDHKDPRFAALDRGEALFRVRHDPARPFRVQVGEAHVEDVGTVFDIIRDGRETRVAVAEGSVRYAAGGTSTPLGAGQAIVDRGGVVQLAEVSRAAVGGWQGGRLIYSGQSLSQVAADLSRFLGTDIVVSSLLADRPFSGAIVLDPRASAADQRQRLAVALDVALEVGTQGWTMKPPARAGR